MVGISSLNRNNPLVLIMEQEYEKTRQMLIDYTRKSVKSIILITIIGFISSLISFIYLPSYLFLSIASIVYIYKTMKTTIQETELHRVGNILFGEDYDILKINEEDVYNSTRMLCRMQGVLQGHLKLLNVITVVSIGSMALSIIASVIKIIFEVIMK